MNASSLYGFASEGAFMLRGISSKLGANPALPIDAQSTSAAMPVSIRYTLRLIPSVIMRVTQKGFLLLHEKNLLYMP
jgi:hypothetical protein